jgi:hypothetical protein
MEPPCYETRIDPDKDRVRTGCPQGGRERLGGSIFKIAYQKQKKNKDPDKDPTIS